MFQSQAQWDWAPRFLSFKVMLLKLLVLTRLTLAQFCTIWPNEIGCVPNSCVSDIACGPSLKCLDSKCVLNNCLTFGDSSCPSSAYKCLDNGCVLADYYCDKFGNTCLNTSLICKGSTCVIPINGERPTTTTTKSDTETSEPTGPNRRTFNSSTLPEWTFYIFLPVSFLFICLYWVLSKTLHREYSVPGNSVSSWFGNRFGRRNLEPFQPPRNFRLTPDYLVDAYIPPTSSDCTTVIGAVSVRSLESGNADHIPSPIEPLPNQNASLILHVGNQDSALVEENENQSEIQSMNSEPISPSTAIQGDNS